MSYHSAGYMTGISHVIIIFSWLKQVNYYGLSMVKGVPTHEDLLKVSCIA